LLSATQPEPPEAFGELGPSHVAGVRNGNVDQAYRKLKRPIWVFEEVNLTPTYATNGIGCSRELFGGQICRALGDGAPVVEIYREPQADAWGVLGAAVIILLGGNFGYRRLAAGAHHAGAREG